MSAGMKAVCRTFSFACVLLFAMPATGQSNKSLVALSDSFEQLVEKVSPSVVQIFSTGYAPATAPATTAESLLPRRRSGGSGVIVSPDGYIVTNAHVVEGARRVQVLLAVPAQDTGPGGSILRPKGEKVGAQILGIDRETDIAVLKIGGKGLPHSPLSDSDELRKGEIVLAFGSPLGLENSVSMGVVSSVARQLRPEDPMIYIQTDATINPGNSGGPLVDTAGRVVGINTFIITHSGGHEGIGFAAPSNIVRNVYNQILAGGRVRRGEIGVNAQTVTPTMSSGLGLPRTWGVILGDVYPGGPADQAGLRIGDIVLSLDGKIMENGRQFDVNLYRHTIGDRVRLEVQRGAETLEFSVEVIERADDPARFADLVSPDENLVPRMGILCIDLNRETLPLLPQVRIKEGVIVAARAADAPFLEGTLMPGDVIHELNGQRIRDLDALQTAVNGLRPGEAAVCQIERGAQLLYVAFEIE